jgi:hypothetical protein
MQTIIASGLASHAIAGADEIISDAGKTRVRGAPLAARWRDLSVRPSAPARAEGRRAAQDDIKAWMKAREQEIARGPLNRVQPYMLPPQYRQRY